MVEFVQWEYKDNNIGYAGITTSKGVRIVRRLGRGIHKNGTISNIDVYEAICPRCNSSFIAWGNLRNRIGSCGCAKRKGKYDDLSHIRRYWHYIRSSKLNYVDNWMAWDNFLEFALSISVSSNWIKSNPDIQFSKYYDHYTVVLPINYKLHAFDINEKIGPNNFILIPNISTDEFNITSLRVKSLTGPVRSELFKINGVYVGRNCIAKIISRQKPKPEGNNTLSNAKHPYGYGVSRQALSYMNSADILRRLREDDYDVEMVTKDRSINKHDHIRNMSASFYHFPRHMSCHSHSSS